MGQTLAHVRLGNPFLLRTLEPPLSSVEGRVVCGLRRVGKRIAIGVEGEIWLVLHLMIAGRLHWRPPPPNWEAGRIWRLSISRTARSR